MQFLLERLAHAPRAGNRPGAADAGGPGAADAPGFDLRLAVLQQIQRLLGIHVTAGDSGLHLMDMALPALADVQDPNDQLQLAARLHDLINRHEPRLKVLRVSVEPVKSPLVQLQLVVEGRLLDQTEPDSLRFELPRR